MEDKEFDYTKATKKRIVWAIIVLMISIISSVLIERTLFRYVHTPFPIITPSPYSRITRTPYPTIPTPDAYETIISPTNSPTPSFIPTEHTTGTATTRSSSSNASSANLEFEYPPHMRRRESQIVILRISLNGLSLSNRSIQRIPSEADNPLVFNIYRESIYYGEKPIRATLRSSSALMIKPMMQSQDDQVFYIESEGMSWGWIIEAADHDATVPIILSLYHGYSSLAFWTTIANIDISGVAFPTETLVPTSTFTITFTPTVTFTPTATPTFTLTPTPTPTLTDIQKIENGLTDHPEVIAGAIIAGIVAIIVAIINNVGKKETEKKKVRKAKK